MLYLTSCVNDDFSDSPNLQKEKNYQLKKISFNELKTNSKAFEKLKESRLKKNPSLQYRGVYNDDYGVFIDTTNIIIVEDGDKHSITFQIISEEESNTKVENLVLNSKDNGSYEAFIAEYNLTQQDLIKLADGETLTTKKPSSITAIETLGRFNIGGDGADCININIYTVSMCRNASGNIIQNNGELGNDCVGMAFDVEYMVLTIDAGCLSGSGGGPGSGSPGNGGPGSGGPGSGGPGSGGGPGGGGPSSGGPSDGNTGTPTTGNPPSGGNTGNPGAADPQLTDSEGNPILTTPLLEVDPNVRKLKRISSNTDIKAKINELRAKCTNPNQLTEDGAQYIKSGSGYTERLPDATFPDETRFDPSFVSNV